MDNSTLMELRNLTVDYTSRRGRVRAVDGVYLSLKRGEILGLVGESGCGKSTVLLSILGLIRSPGMISAGEIRFRGKGLRTLSPRAMRSIRGKEISMIFQDPLSTLNPAFAVGEQIREALWLHQILPGRRMPWPFDSVQRRLEKRRVLEVMAEVGIPSPMDRYKTYPHQFSGGMQQRALIAMALVCEPALLLADEPTTALDVTIQAQIMDLMRRVNREHGTAIILVTHDLALASEFCDRIAVMYAGRIVEQGDTDRVVLFPQHPYTRGLLECRPSLSGTDQRILPIPGNVPDLSSLPLGCAFAPRCAEAMKVCETGPIPMFLAAHAQLSRCLKHTGFQRQDNWGWSDIVEAANGHDSD